ncbi:MAG: UDP-N-acetylmuramate dehydrogenase [Bacteroidetes bacterium]|nr:UDP-N-acetylmuramate dehydrogenase [Bacteroidota bacterium]MBK9671456.1 UDP-N-acetylmuramate dehydrogenase [Bacteroidota bacterium]MBK9799413.1 UDP-N-acetylmuramate dehydrogenase [Bacteroidota bacterium]MBP6413580.1 UDP-N-acetylmuramate dehydrogenase [Bacteroidia bacterium]
MTLLENYSLKTSNTFGIEASARYYLELLSSADIEEFVHTKKWSTVPHLILGGGSNLLFTKNFDGIVLKNKLKGISLVKETPEHVFVKAQAGEIWHNFVLHCIQHNYAGVENLSLIPGCVGASPMQNIGAYGVEIKDVFHELEAISLTDGATKIFSATECEFGYRESVFKRKYKNQFIIVSVTFKLNKHPKFNTSYGAIEKEMEAMGVTEISIAAISKAVCNIRSSKLPNPIEIGNAGSFFKNPVVSSNKFEQLKGVFPEIVGYKNSATETKLAAGWLIEQCGWKGYRLGDAGVHKNQALVLVNYKEASGREIFDLSQQILDSVKAKFEVELEREVNII